MVMNFGQSNTGSNTFKRAVPSTAILAKNNNRKAAKPLELTRDYAFLDGTHDIFDVLARQSRDKDAIERNLGSTIALLKRSSKMLQDAENTIAAQNERIDALEEINTIDEVSGLLNRRGFIYTLRQEVARTSRNKNEGGLLVMFNLENMSKIRSEHGREAANMAVRLVTKALKSEIREYDHAGRLLDDEFVLLFTDTGMDKALARLQNMALRMNKLSLIWDGCEINLNLSLGLKSFNEHDRADDIFKAASDDLKRNRKGQKATKTA